jgi:hypothetical protein
MSKEIHPPDPMPKNTQEMFFVIADISGYTKFMLTSRTEITHSQGIISDLLNAVIAQVEIPLTIAKFEGDAIFMYAAKEGNHDWQTVKNMLGNKLFAFIEAFDKKLQQLAESNICHCQACLGMGKLKLKVVTHYGQALRYEISGHTELSGVDVIIVHRLLKNHLPVNKYVLLSDCAQQQLKIEREWQKTVESYPEDIGAIKVYWLALESAEIEVKTNRLNIGDMCRKIKYDFMKIFNLFKNKA